jgi:3-hydroxyacyl-[acyl-carrier-protein] dehydratase
MQESTSLKIEEIMALIPHRYPFLLVDRIESVVPSQSAVGIKCVSMNEPMFQGHFPGKPLMPGVLIVEALAQVGAVALMSEPANQGKLAVFAGIDDVRFKRQVVPGDVLRLEVTIDSLRRGIGKGTALATVNGEVACKGSLMFALIDA